jgi:ATP-dependent RNA helicase DeaD
MSTKTFADLGLSTQVLEALTKKGFTTPSPIQAGVIPLLLQGDKDIIGQAQTGTGKTAAFALPLLERLDPKLQETQAVILAPTRELAVQVAKEIESFCVANSPSITVVYGGNAMYKEKTALKRNPAIVVGTPGRMQHHIRTGSLRIEKLQYFILDEADEMLNFGFREEIEEMLEKTPKKKKVLLFSATMPKTIMNIVHKYMGEYDMVKVAAKDMTNENITQKYYCVHRHDKFEALCRIIEDEETFYAIVFCRTKIDTDFVATSLIAKHFRAEAIHGDIDQSQREKILARFKAGKTHILVATDVAARGIDVNELRFVINYSLPENYDIYTHRIGRTGRAGNTGTAMTFITPNESRQFRSFERNLNVKIAKGSLPTPEDLVAKKQKHIIERLDENIKGEKIASLAPVVKKLLKNHKPEDIINALLQESYANDFDVKSYKKIEDQPLGSSSYSSGGGRGGYRGGRGSYGGGGRGGYGGGNSGGYRKKSYGRSQDGGNRSSSYSSSSSSSSQRRGGYQSRRT